MVGVASAAHLIVDINQLAVCNYKLMNTFVSLVALLLVVSALPPANGIRVGKIVLHDAMPRVLVNFPERAQVGVDGYVATTDCVEIGRRFVLVRPGLPDALVAVADCAWEQDAHYRNLMGYIADVDRALWKGAERPQDAQLWPVGLREAFLLVKERGKLWTLIVGQNQ